MFNKFLFICQLYLTLFIKKIKIFVFESKISLFISLSCLLCSSCWSKCPRTVPSQTRTIGDFVWIANSVQCRICNWSRCLFRSWSYSRMCVWTNVHNCLRLESLLWEKIQIYFNQNLFWLAHFLFTWFSWIRQTFGMNTSSSLNSSLLIGFIDLKCHLNKKKLFIRFILGRGGFQVANHC